MATRAAAKVDPLVEELPISEEPRPKRASDVKFEIEISPYVVGGRHFFRWVIIDHNAKPYIGDYVGHNDSSYESTAEAEIGATEYVDRIRYAVDLKLSAPEAYRITI